MSTYVGPVSNEFFRFSPNSETGSHEHDVAFFGNIYTAFAQGIQHEHQELMAVREAALAACMSGLAPIAPYHAYTRGVERARRGNVRSLSAAGFQTRRSIGVISMTNCRLWPMVNSDFGSYSPAPGQSLTSEVLPISGLDKWCATRAGFCKMNTWTTEPHLLRPSIAPASPSTS